MKIWSQKKKGKRERDSEKVCLNMVLMESALIATSFYWLIIQWVNNTNATQTKASSHYGWNNRKSQNKVTIHNL